MSRFFTEADEREPIYEFDPGEVISDTPPNVVWIRPRMNMRMRSKAQTAALSLADEKVEADFSKNLVELAVLNIIDWEGPDFLDKSGKKVPVTRQNIERLVEGDPFIGRVMDEIGKRNKRAKSPDPKSPATPGSTNDGVTSLIIPASTTAS